MKMEGETFCDWIEKTMNAEDQKLKDPMAGIKLLNALYEAGIGEKPAANDSATDEEKLRSELADARNMGEDAVMGVLNSLGKR